MGWLALRAAAIVARRSRTLKRPVRLWSLLAVRADALALCAAVLGPLALYALTMPRAVVLEDDGLFLMAGAHLGVAHPPGYPLHTLIVHLFMQLPFGPPALLGHLSSAVTGALACGALFACARLLGASVGLAMAAWSVQLGWPANDRSGGDLMRRYADLLFAVLPENALFLAKGDFETPPLGYYRYVEGRRPDLALLEFDGFVFGNRLYSPLAPEAERLEALRRHLADSGRRVFFTQVKRDSCAPGRGSPRSSRPSFFTCGRTCAFGKGAGRRPSPCCGGPPRPTTTQATKPPKRCAKSTPAAPSRWAGDDALGEVRIAAVRGAGAFGQAVLGAGLARCRGN